MTVRRKAPTKAEPTEVQAEAMISRGGQPALRGSELDEVRFTLRIPKEMTERLDASRRHRVGHVSRNTCILEAIEAWLKLPNAT